MVEITEDAISGLIQILERRFPHRKNLRINNLEEITEGWETIIYGFTLNYEVNNQSFAEDFIIRFFQGPSRREQARKEFTVMKKIAQWEIPVPQVEILVMNNSPFKSPFIVMEKIRGETMSHALQGAAQHEILRSMKLMISQFVKLHGIPWREVFPDLNHVDLTEDGPLAYVESKISSLWKVVNRYELDEFAALLFWLEERIDLGPAKRLSVIHNDYHPQNILLREDENGLAIIDWSFAEVGDYRLDLAWSVLLSGVMIGNHYREIMVETYEELAGTSVDNFEYFEALKFTERMVTIATWLDESVEIPVKKITKEAMRREYRIHIFNVYNRLKAITGIRLHLIENL